jgi:glutathione S-transferase
MSLTLYFHPLASFCHKVLIALYENDTPFSGHVVDLGDRNASAAFLELWPAGKIPLLRDAARDATIPESTIIIEYLHTYHPGARSLLPGDAAARLDARLWDRFFDLYVQAPMQKIVADRLRNAGEQDPIGVAEARSVLQTAYGMIETRMQARTWATGNEFSIADCAAAPALFYASIIVPFPATCPRLAAYFERLLERTSVQRVIVEARPWLHLFPFRDAIPARFL